MSGRYDAEQFTKYELAAMRAVGDLRGELQAPLRTSQAQHPHLDGLTEQQTMAKGETQQLASQRGRLEAAFKRMHGLQEGRRAMARRVRSESAMATFQELQKGVVGRIDAASQQCQAAVRATAQRAPGVRGGLRRMAERGR